MKKGRVVKEEDRIRESQAVSGINQVQKNRTHNLWIERQLLSSLFPIVWLRCLFINIKVPAIQFFMTETHSLIYVLILRLFLQTSNEFITCQIITLTHQSNRIFLRHITIVVPSSKGLFQSQFVSLFEQSHQFSLFFFVCNVVSCWFGVFVRHIFFLEGLNMFGTGPALSEYYCECESDGKKLRSGITIMPK